MAMRVTIKNEDGSQLLLVRVQERKALHASEHHTIEDRQLAPSEVAEFLIDKGRTLLIFEGREATSSEAAT